MLLAPESFDEIKETKMITIDGSYGEGGGQILRTSLALSLITGKPFRIEKIRAGRRKPGLMRQHLTALNAAAEIGSAEVTGNKIGSTDFTFTPKTIKSGNYRFAIGTAGSCTLVLQTVLPALLVADGPSELVLEGGTHNPFAPPYDFLAKAFLPILSKMGAEIRTELSVYGFYPAGGGRFSVSVKPPEKLMPTEIIERGEILKAEATALVSNVPEHVAERELRMVKNKLGWNGASLKTEVVENSPGPGNILTLAVQSKDLTEIFTGFGEKGVSAERVAKQAIRSAKEYISSGAPVGKYLADQLLVPMAIAGGGRYRTHSPTRHTLTNIDIIKKFIDIDIRTEHINNNCCDITLG